MENVLRKTLEMPEVDPAALQAQQQSKAVNRLKNITIPLLHTHQEQWRQVSPRSFHSDAGSCAVDSSQVETQVSIRV